MSDDPRRLPAGLVRGRLEAAEPVARLVDGPAPALHGVASELRPDRSRPGASPRRRAVGRHPDRLRPGRRGGGPRPRRAEGTPARHRRSPRPCSPAPPPSASAAAVALGVAGVVRVGAGLIAFVVVGSVIVVAYNLESWGGRLHSDVVFAAGWGAFPVLTAYFVQTGTIRLAALLGCRLRLRPLARPAGPQHRGADAAPPGRDRRGPPGPGRRPQRTALPPRPAAALRAGPGLVVVVDLRARPGPRRRPHQPVAASRSAAPCPAARRCAVRPR